MTDFFIVFSAEYLGYMLLLILAVSLLRDIKKHLPLVIQMIAAVILSRGIVVELFRIFWHRDRPFVVHHVAPLIPMDPLESAFPSGHAAVFFAIATIAYAHNKKLGMILFAGALLMGIGRVLARVHWPSDIVGGAAAGIISGVVALQLSKRIWKNASSS